MHVEEPAFKRCSSNILECWYIQHGKLIPFLLAAQTSCCSPIQEPSANIHICFTCCFGTKCFNCTTLFFFTDVTMDTRQCFLFVFFVAGFYLPVGF